MIKTIVVTNRRLCTRPFLEQIRIAAKMTPNAILLREKDLSEQEYEELARSVLAICEEFHVPCILHTYVELARKLDCRRIHLPLSEFIRQAKNITNGDFDEIGVSIHSVEDALTAESLGATYLTAGHIFATDCKKGIAPRGLEFLKQICKKVSIPVYAIGGIHPANMEEPFKAGAAGVCMMSEFMKMDEAAVILNS